MPGYEGIGRAMQWTPSALIRLAFIAWLVLSGRVADAAQQSTPTAMRPAVSAGHLGLYDALAFRIGTGQTLSAEPRAAFWFFRDDVVAEGIGPPLETLDDGQLTVEDDIRRWSANGGTTRPALPFLVWMGSPDVIEHGSLSADGKALDVSGAPTQSFSVVPRIASNRSYYDAASVAYLSGKPIRMRGIRGADGSSFEARTLWPEDWRLDVPPTKPLASGETLAALIEAENGGAAAPYATRVLWERSPGAAGRSEGRAVLGFVLNGAQGDDDEAHGGHFAVLTGWLGPDRSMADWMVNNFYNLGTVSEKGIIAAMLPMDAYMTDLNSGQAWYRPSYLLVAILDDPAPAQQFQNAIIRVFERFYRQHVQYDHAQANCAGISVDTLSGLGWNCPRLGPTSTPKAVAGYFYSSATDLDFASGKKTFHYLTEERVRLYPRAAFETLGDDLLAMATSSSRATSDYEKLIAAHVQAIVFVRIPQIPSSRAMGTFPVDSFDAYMARVPADRKDWKIVPVDSRPFPDELRDRSPVQPVLSDSILGVLAVGGLLITTATPVVWWRRRRTRRAWHR